MTPKSSNTQTDDRKQHLHKLHTRKPPKPHQHSSSRWPTDRETTRRRFHPFWFPEHTWSKHWQRSWNSYRNRHNAHAGHRYTGIINKQTNHGHQLTGGNAKFMMGTVFNQAKTIYSSTPSDPQCKYQPGGNLLPTTQAATKWDDLLGPQQKVNGTRGSS